MVFGSFDDCVGVSDWTGSVGYNDAYHIILDKLGL